VTFEDAIEEARRRARQMKVDPSLTIAEVYEAELLRRLQRRLRTALVWKGGAVLRLAGSGRFSRDLDATRRPGRSDPPAIVRALKAVSVGLAYLTNVVLKKQRQSITAVYRFAVPGLLQPLRISVEVSLREKVLLSPTTISSARMAHPSGIEPVVVARLDDPELLAEKVRALVMRMAGRDIYDVYWLLQHGVQFDLELFLKKMLYYAKIGQKVEPAATMEKALRQLEKYDPNRAKAEIVNLFPVDQRHLDLAVVVEDVRRALRSWHEQLTARLQRPRPKKRK